MAIIAIHKPLFHWKMTGNSEWSFTLIFTWHTKKVAVVLYTQEGFKLYAQTQNGTQ